MTVEATTTDFAAILRDMQTDHIYATVEIDRLKVDRRYQRRIDKARVTRYSDRFDERLLGVLVCSVRDDGDIYVIDGQHRLELLRRRGFTTARVELRGGLTLADEARMFYELDTNRAGLSSNDSFRAMLVAGDRIALGVMDAITANGFRVGNMPGPNNIRCFKTLIKLATQYGLDRVQDTLAVLHEAWPDTENAAPAAVVEGMAYFLGAYPDVDKHEVARTLSINTNPRKLLEAARSLTESLSWNTKLAMARAIVAIYNTRRSAGVLDERAIELARVHAGGPRPGTRPARPAQGVPAITNAS